jgi:hypothetical protein
MEPPDLEDMGIPPLQEFPGIKMWDQSLDKYLLDNNIRALSPRSLYPETEKVQQEVSIPFHLQYCY